VHGHNGLVLITATASQVDSVGRVIDFGVLKDLFGGWLDQFWDHAMLIYAKDTELLQIWNGPLNGHKYFVCPFNPTSENMAGYLLNNVAPKLLKDTDVEVSKIIFFETENCSSEATLEKSFRAERIMSDERVINLEKRT
jgi:6-pyruvoyltetrahydropterin/6-carboxytetrahydropterin synthase